MAPLAPDPQGVQDPRKRGSMRGRPCGLRSRLTSCLRLSVMPRFGLLYGTAALVPAWAIHALAAEVSLWTRPAPTRLGRHMDLLSTRCLRSQLGPPKLLPPMIPASNSSTMDT